MKIKRIIPFIITIVYIFALFSFASSAYIVESKSRIKDDDNYISFDKQMQLEDKLRSAEESSGVAFRVYVYEYSMSEGYVDMYDYERIVGEDFTDLVLLIVSYEYGEYFYELFTKGSPDTQITDKEAYKILDNNSVYDNIKSGNLYEGISAYIDLAETAVSGKLRNSFKSVLVVSLVISFIVATALAVCVVVKYRKKLHSASYPLDRYARLDLNVAYDNFRNKAVTRTRVRSSSSSSGGGGRSSGGGSRGRR